MPGPLHGKTILLTRQPDQNHELQSMIETAGGRVLAVPMIEISAPDNWRDCDNSIGELASYHWLVFTSLYGVRFFLDRCHELHAWPQTNRIAAIGAKTAETIQTYGLSVQLLPKDFSASGLLEAFGEMDISGQRFLLPASEIARPDLADGLKKMRAHVKPVVVYRNTPPTAANVQALLQQLKHLNGMVFFSPSALRNFMQLIGDANVNSLQMRGVPLAVIGPTTATSARDAGFTSIIQAPNSTTHDLFQALVDWFQHS